MAGYESLKDYFLINRKDEILHSINDFIQTNKNPNSNLILKDITILSLQCIDFIRPSATVFMDVSAEVYDTLGDDFYTKYYGIMLNGDVTTGFSDMSVSLVQEISETELQKDDVQALFGLPIISRDTLEEEAIKLHRTLRAGTHINPEHKYWFPVISIKEKFKKSDNMHMWPADLPDNCLGRLYLKPSRETIYNIEDMSRPYPDTPIPANSILLNSNYYRNKIPTYDDIITAAHEIVHWSLHRLYFDILQLLEEKYDHMECSAEEIIFEDAMSLKEKAYWYAEWQANELAIRVAIPKRFVAQAIDEYNNDESVHNPGDIPFSGRYYQNMVYKLSMDFNVPMEIMKKRLRQLGYDFADGTLNTVDDSLYPPFTFSHGTLKENESFVINRANYERLLREDAEFAELINDKMFVYTGYVVCLYDAKYIKPVNTGEKLIFIFTDYGREHADECLLKFKYKTVTVAGSICQPYISSYFNKIPDYNEIIPESFELCKYDSETKNNITEKEYNLIKEFNDTLNDLNSPQKKTFANTVVYHMRKKQIEDKELAKRTRLSKEAIKKICNGETKNPDAKNIMALCIGLQLDVEECYDLFEKANYDIREDTMQNRAYRYLFTHDAYDIDYCNRILRHFSQDSIPYHKRNSKKGDLKKL